MQPKAILKEKRRVGLRKEKSGGEGYRSPYLSHAKRALYHLSYTPFHLHPKRCLLDTRTEIESGGKETEQGRLSTVPFLGAKDVKNRKKCSHRIPRNSLK